MAYFAGYGFNKSIAPLMPYWLIKQLISRPIIRGFMSALLSSVMGNTDKITVYLEECRRLGIQVLPPMNESQIDFIIKEGKLVLV